jgi:predicted nucleic-acid-binding Zn-ribbon protein
MRTSSPQGLAYRCPKCENQSYEVGEFRAAGGFFTKIFDVQSKKFTTVSCRRCRYTEIFKADSSMLGNIFDFFTD